MPKKYVQQPPNAVQIELVEGCNLRCTFCGLNGIRGKENNFKFMTEQTLRTIMFQLKNLHDEGWNPRVEFAMHGEPTMHPDYVGMIRAARDEAPHLQLMMTSNGGGLLKQPGPEKNIGDLFRAGLNVLALDNYESVNIVPKILSALTEDTLKDEKGKVIGGSRIENARVSDLVGQEYICFPNDGIQVYSYPRDRDGNPHAKRSKGARVLTVIRDISKAQKGNHSRLANHAGAAGPKTDLMAGKRCAKPFREMSIRWDGSVAICCDDWRGTYKIGRVRDQTVGELWQDPRFMAARKKLYHGMRDFGPCKGCSAKSYRVGLLPDKFGKEELPLPGREDNEFIKAALMGKPLATPVLRPWEKK